MGKTSIAVIALIVLIVGALLLIPGGDRSTTAVVGDDAVDEAATSNEVAVATEEAVDTAKELAVDAFTVAGFDAAKVRDAIEGSGLGEDQKATLNAVLSSAEADPNLLRHALSEVRSALGI